MPVATGGVDTSNVIDDLSNKANVCLLARPSTHCISVARLIASVTSVQAAFNVSITIAHLMLSVAALMDDRYSSYLLLMVVITVMMIMHMMVMVVAPPTRKMMMVVMVMVVII